MKIYMNKKYVRENYSHGSVNAKIIHEFEFTKKKRVGKKNTVSSWKEHHININNKRQIIYKILTFLEFLRGLVS